MAVDAIYEEGFREYCAAKPSRRFRDVLRQWRTDKYEDEEREGCSLQTKAVAERHGHGVSFTIEDAFGPEGGAVKWLDMKCVIEGGVFGVVSARVRTTKSIPSEAEADTAHVRSIVTARMLRAREINPASEARAAATRVLLEELFVVGWSGGGIRRILSRISNKKIRNDLRTAARYVKFVEPSRFTARQLV